MTLKRERYEFLLTQNEAHAIALALQNMREANDQIRFVIVASLSDDEEDAMAKAIAAYAEKIITAFGRPFHLTEVHWSD